MQLIVRKVLGNVRHTVKVIFNGDALCNVFLHFVSSINGHIGLVSCSAWTPEELCKHFTGVPAKKRYQGRPRITWKHSVWRDIEPIDMAWDDVCLKPIDGDEWKGWTARCASHEKDKGLRSTPQPLWRHLISDVGWK